MTNIIVKDGIVVYATEDEILLPLAPDMIEVTPYGENGIIRIGGGDINGVNSFLYVDVELPIDYKPSKYLYDDTFTLNPNYTEE